MRRPAANTPAHAGRSATTCRRARTTPRRPPATAPRPRPHPAKHGVGDAPLEQQHLTQTSGPLPDAAHGERAQRDGRESGPTTPARARSRRCTIPAANTPSAARRAASRPPPASPPTMPPPQQLTMKPYAVPPASNSSSARATPATSVKAENTDQHGHRHGRPQHHPVADQRDAALAQLARLPMVRPVGRPPPAGRRRTRRHRHGQEQRRARPGRPAAARPRPIAPTAGRAGHSSAAVCWAAAMEDVARRQRLVRHQGRDQRAEWPTPRRALDGRTQRGPGRSSARSRARTRPDEHQHLGAATAPSPPPRVAGRRSPRRAARAAPSSPASPPAPDTQAVCRSVDHVYGQRDCGRRPLAPRRAPCAGGQPGATTAGSRGSQGVVSTAAHGLAAVRPATRHSCRPRSPTPPAGA